jgi:integrase
MKKTKYTDVNWTTISNYLHSKKYSTGSINTFRWYYNNFSKFFKRKDITKKNFYKFFNIYKTEHSPATIDGLIGFLKIVGKVYGISFFKKIKYIKKVRPASQVLSEEEIRRLIKIETPRKKSDGERKLLNMRYSKAIYLMYFTGVTIGELSNLRWSDLQNETLVIKGKYTGKNREIILSPQFIQDINILPKNKKNNFIFGNNQGQLGIHSFNKELKNRAHLLGISKKITSTTLRTSFISNMLKNGEEISEIAKVVGHRSTTSTAFYSKKNHRTQSEMVNPNTLLVNSEQITILKKRVIAFLSRFGNKKQFIAYEENDKRLIIKIINTND